jgi:hypothetical protein
MFLGFGAVDVLGAEAVCYLVKHKWPAAHVFLWFLGSFTTLWVLGAAWSNRPIPERGSEKIIDTPPLSSGAR